MSKSKAVGSRTVKCKGNAPELQKRYEGKRSYDQAFVTVNGHALDPRFDLHTHSPDGFEWGYGGSGPSQLALALLADHFNDDNRAIALHQAFKWAVVAKLPRDCWRLTGQQIEDTLRIIRDQSGETGGAQ